MNEPQFIKKEVFKKGNTLFECNFKTGEVKEAILQDDPNDPGNKWLVFDPTCTYIQAYKKETAEKMFKIKVDQINQFAKKFQK